MAGVIVFLLQTLSVPAENTLDAFSSALDDVAKQHQQAVAQNMASFISQIEAAAGSPDAAIDLYQKAGGTMPAPAPVTSSHQNETPDEKAAREAQDQANAANLAYTAQLHCGVMLYAALFATTPGQKGLKEAWAAWLKTSAPIYAQVKATPRTPKSGGQRGNWNQNRPEELVSELKNKSVSTSIISDYLSFKGWGDAEQANWSVKQIPDLYRSTVLEPLRVTPSADTLASWDVYIALKSADQPDADQWNQIDLPSLTFEKDCDDYAITHTMDKLQAMLDLIQANPSHPKLGDMIARTKALVADYRSRHAAATAPLASTPPPAGGNPSANVTTVTDGDMTIITTHPNTNTPSAMPSQPPTPGPVPAPTPAP